MTITNDSCACSVISCSLMCILGFLYVETNWLYVCQMLLQLVTSNENTHLQDNKKPVAYSSSMGPFRLDTLHMFI